MPGMREVLLSADHILTMNPENAVIENGAVLVRGDRIAAIGRHADLARQHPAVERRSFRNRLLMPGLINAHCHSGLLRGTAESLPVWDWLRLHIDPMHRVLQARDAEAASRLCYAEAVLSGTTTLVDMWRYMDGSARAAAAIGNRAVLVPYVGEHPDYNYFESLDDNERLLETWHGGAQGRVQVWVGLEHVFYADQAGLQRAVDLAQRFRTGLHTHSNEAQVELAEMERRYGLRPVQALERLGLLEPETVLLAHCVWLDACEIDILARRGIGVAHNPTSNMKLASGAAPVQELLAAGVAVGLGTDGEKENNNLDMFEEMKFASLLTKLARMDAAALDSWEVLRMATINGAKCLGLADEIGSLEPGKKADIIAVRTDTPRMTPLLGGPHGNLHHNLVHAVQGGDVDMTMVDGTVIVEDGRLKTADMADLIAEIHAVVPALFERRAAFLANHKDGAVSPVS